MMKIHWYKSKKGGVRCKNINDATISKYGFHFGGAFVDNYGIHNYEYAHVGLNDNNKIIIKFVHLPIEGHGTAYKINFHKNTHAKGCFIAAASFVKGLPDTIYAREMIVEKCYFDDTIFEIRPKEAYEQNIKY